VLLEGPGVDAPAIACTPDGAVAVAAIGLESRGAAPGEPKQAPPRLRLATWDVATGRGGITLDADLQQVDLRGGDEIPLKK
jgi:hypothetical protein